MVDIMLPSEHRARTLKLLSDQQAIADAKQKSEDAAAARQRDAQMRELFRQYGPQIMKGDENALGEYSRLAGPDAALKTQGDVLTNRTAQQTLDDKKRTAMKAEVDDIMKALTAVQYADPEVRGLLWKQQMRDLQARGHDTSQVPQDYDEQWVKTKTAELMTFSEQLQASRPPPLELREIYDETSPTKKRFVPEAEAVGKPAGAPPGEGGETIRSQQSDTFRLPDGSTVKGEFIPNRGLGYRKNGVWTPLPDGAEPTTPSAGGSLTPQQFLVLREKFTQEQQALQRLNRYGETVGGINTGLQNWADRVSANVKTAMGNKTLSQAEFSRLSAQGQLQALLGLFRTDVVGPGVMTEYDAQRVADALGGNVDSLQNPQVVASLLKNLYADKMQRLRLYESEIRRNSPVFNVDPMTITAPSEFGGVGATPAPTAPAASGGWTVRKKAP